MWNPTPMLTCCLIALSVVLAGCDETPPASPTPAPAATSQAPEPGPQPPARAEGAETPPSPTVNVAEAEGPAGFASPRDAALAALNAHKSADVEALFLTFPRTGLVHGDLPPVERVFPAGAWETTAARAWDGTLGPARHKGPDVRIRFATSGDDVLTAGVFVREGRWYFRKLFRMAATAFEAWGDEVAR